jgi:hypothetical protein
MKAVDCILRHTNRVQAVETQIRNIHFNIIPSVPQSRSGLYPKPLQWDSELRNLDPLQYHPLVYASIIKVTFSPYMVPIYISYISLAIHTEQLSPSDNSSERYVHLSGS